MSTLCFPLHVHTCEFVCSFSPEKKQPVNAASCFRVLLVPISSVFRWRRLGRSYPDEKKSWHAPVLQHSVGVLPGRSWVVLPVCTRLHRRSNGALLCVVDGPRKAYFVGCSSLPSTAFYVPVQQEAKGNARSRARAGIADEREKGGRAELGRVKAPSRANKNRPQEVCETASGPFVRVRASRCTLWCLGESSHAWQKNVCCFRQ